MKTSNASYSCKVQVHCKNTRYRKDKGCLTQNLNHLRFCRIITNNKEQGDELYQDAMVLLLEKRASLKAEQNSKSYALSVAVLLWKNKKKKYANRMRIAPVSSLEEHQETVSSFAADWDTTPEQMMINKQEIAEVRNAVQMLPEKYRIPICLSYSAGLTMEEIATCMKVPVNTVKTRIRKAKSILKQELEARGIDR